MGERELKYSAMASSDLLPAILMRLLTIISLLTLFFSCKTEYRKVIDTYLDGKIKEENVYLSKDDKSKYTVIEYFQNGQISFKGIVEK
jgi:hypothetical protein